MHSVSCGRIGPGFCFHGGEAPFLPLPFFHHIIIYPQSKSFFSAMIFLLYVIPSDRRATWHCVEHIEPDRNGSACPAQARISTSPSFVLCEHYGSFHSQICGADDSTLVISRSIHELLRNLRNESRGNSITFQSFYLGDRAGLRLNTTGTA